MSDHVHGEDCDHGDDEGIDLLRLTLVGEHTHCSINPTAFKDEPGTWGAVLAELALNLSEALADDPVSQQKVLEEIRANFLEALDAPPDAE